MSEPITENLNTSVPIADCIKKKDIFVGNLSLYTNPEKLRVYFSKFGDIENVRIMIHAETRRSRRFGFITFCQESAVTSVLQVQEGMKFQLDGCKLDVKHAFKRSDEEGGVPPVQKTKKPFVPRNIFENFKSSVGMGDAKVFVGGLGKETTEEDIREFFSPFGEIKRINLVMDRETNRSKEATTNVTTPLYTWPMWPNFGQNFGLSNWNPGFWTQMAAGPTRMEYPRQPRYTPYPLATFEQDPAAAAAALYPLQSLLQAAQASTFSFLAAPPSTSAAFMSPSPQVISPQMIGPQGIGPQVIGPQVIGPQMIPTSTAYMTAPSPHVIQANSMPCPSEPTLI